MWSFHHSTWTSILRSNLSELSLATFRNKVCPCIYSRSDTSHLRLMPQWQPNTSKQSYKDCRAKSRWATSEKQTEPEGPLVTLVFPAVYVHCGHCQHCTFSFKIPQPMNCLLSRSCCSKVPQTTQLWIPVITCELSLILFQYCTVENGGNNRTLFAITDSVSCFDPAGHGFTNACGGPPKRRETLVHGNCQTIYYKSSVAKHGKTGSWHAK